MDGDGTGDLWEALRGPRSNKDQRTEGSEDLCNTSTPYSVQSSTTKSKVMVGVQAT
jgi:hypothetical protein